MSDNTINFPFDETSEYLFINHCLTLLYGNLPSYCYYTSNKDLDNFYDNLSEEEYIIIYKFLLDNYLIEYDDILSPEQAVFEFVEDYFVDYND